MKKFTRVFALMLVCMLAVMALAACGVSQKDADSIKQAIKDGNAPSIKELKDKYGEPTMDLTILNSGSLVWVNGCKTKEDYQKKVEAGKKVEALVVVVVAGAVTGASYGEYKAEK